MRTFNSAPTTSTLRSWWTKTLMLILLVAGGFATGANAQTVTIGSGTGTSIYLPLRNFYGYNYTQQIYTAAQVTQGGKIDKIRFMLNAGGLSNSTDWVVYMGNTAKTSFTSTTDWIPVASMTQVFSGTVPDAPPTGTWMEITLTTPFVYNGTDNLVIAVDENTPGYGSSSTNWRAFTSGSNTGIYYYNDSNNPDPSSPPTASGRSGTISQVQLNFLPPCTGTPVAGTVPASVPACVGSTVTLTATGGTVADGLTYQWLESPNGNAPWTAVGSGSGATTTSYTTPPFSTTAYYRMVTTCTPSGLTDTTNVATVIDGTIPPYAVFDGISLVEDFESWGDGCSTTDKPSPNWNNTPPTGLNSWRRDDQGTSAGWTSSSGIYSPVSSSGTRSARFHSVEAPNSSTGILDLYVDMTAATGNTKLKFAHINDDGADVLRVLVSTNGGSSFTALGADLAQAATWTEHEYTIASTSATTVIRFRATSDLGSTDIGLDNVRLVTPCSGTPAAATASAVPPTVCAGNSTVISATGISTLAGISLQWEDSPDGITGWAVATGGSGATTASYTTPGLLAPRYYRLKQSCSYSALSSYSNTVAVLMNTATYATYNNVSHAEDFESWLSECSTTDIPSASWRVMPTTGNNSWRRHDQGVTGAGWSNLSGAYSPLFTTGAYSARFHSYNTSLEGSLDLHIDMSAATGPTRLSFDHINTSGTDILGVWVSTDGGQNFNQVGNNLGVSATWTNRTFDFNINSATTVIRLLAKGDNGSTDIGVDNLLLAPSPSCVTPLNLTVGIASPTSVNLSWDASVSNPSNGYVWEVRTAGLPGNPGTADANGSTAAGVVTDLASGLTAGVTYNAYVRSDCGGVDTSAWIGPVTFTAGILQIGSGATTNTNFPISSCSAYNYTQQIYLGTEYASGTYITKLKFKYISSGTTIANWNNWTVYMGNTAKTEFASTTDWVPRAQMSQVFSGTVTPVAGQWMEIALSPGFVWDGSSNIVVAVDENTAGTSCTATWSSFTPTGTNRGMYVRGTANPDPNSPATGTRNSTLAQIQFEIGIAPSCLPPSQLSANNVTATDADLNWTASTSNPAEGYQWEVRSDGGAGGSGATGRVDNGLTAAGIVTAHTALLAATTPYTFFVRAICSPGDSSVWAGPFAFTTPCATYPAPFTENFDAAVSLPNCWANIGAEQWLFAASGSTSPGYGVSGSVDHTTGSGNFAWVDGSGDIGVNSLETPMIDMSALTAPYVSFWMLSNNTDDGAQNQIRLDVWDGAAWVALLTYGGNSASWLEHTATVPGGIPSTTKFRLVALPSTTGTGSQFYNDLLIDDFSVIETPACLMPTGPTATNITGTSADFSWTASTSNPANGYQWEVRSSGAGGSGATGLVDNGTTAAGVVTANTALLAGGTTYTLYVRSDCNGTFSLWAASASFTTVCTYYTAPYSENFDAVVSLPNCWANIGAEQWQFQVSGGSGPAYGVASAVDHTSGTGNFAWIDGSGDIGVNSLESPDIDMSALTTPYVSFWMLSNNTDDVAQNQIQLDVWDGAAWVTLLTYGGNSPNWLEHTATVPGGIPSTSKFRLVALPSATGTQYYNDLLIDDFSVVEAPSCLVPTGATATNVTTSSADLSWTASASNPANGYQWEVRTSGAGGSGATGLVDNGTTAAGIVTANTALLAPSTTYTFYVRSDCNGSFSLWAGSSSFTTPCANATLPWTENFDALTVPNLPNCWTNEVGLWVLANAASDTYTDPRSTPNYLRTRYGADDYIWSPAFDLTATTSYDYAFWYATDGNSGWTTVELYVNTTPSSTGATLLGPALSGPTNTAYQQFQRSFVPSSTDTYYFGIHVVSNFTPWYIAFDDFSMNVSPSCLPPSALTATNILATSADLSWTASTSNPANGYQWEVRTSGAGGSGATGLTDNGTTAAGVTTASTSALAAQTTYTLYVRGDCNGDMSPWAASSSFSTPCNASVAPYTENFDAAIALPNCWANIGTEPWEFQVSGGGGPDYGVAGAADHTSGTGNFAWIDGSGGFVTNSLETPFIDMSALTVPYVTFWMLSNNTNDAAQNQIRLDAWDGAAWVTLLTYGGNSASWLEHNTALPGGIPSTTKFRLVALPSATGNVFYNDLLIDDFSVTEAPACVAPTNLTVPAYTASSADLSWTASVSNPANGYLWEVRTSGAGGSGATGLVDNGGTAAGVTTASSLVLSPNTTYYAYVSADCGATQSGWIGPESFYTGYCIPAPTSVDGTGITNVAFGSLNNPSGAEAGNYGDYTGLTGGDVQQTTTATVSITFSTSIYDYATKIWVDWNNDLDFNDVGEEVYTGTSGTTSPNTLVANFPVGGNALGSYRMRIGGADVGPPTPCYTGTYATFEDYTLNITAPPACPTPTNAAVTGITATSASFSWTDNGSGSYDYEVRTSGAAGSGATGLALSGNVAGSPVALALTSNTAYTAYVRSFCAPDSSAWSIGVNFTTPCVAFTLPFQEGFNSSSTTQACWTVLNVNGDGDAWDMNYATNPQEGDQSAVLYTDINAGANDDWLISPALTLSGADRLRYWYRVQSSSEPNDFEVLLSTTGNSPGDFTNTLVPFAAYSNTT
ncbi:MAG: choice-of-anchor J domain-containing protein, partial [Flavobacteriales bacterium]|nr:choice-of-anchor J domain-containing protein [Flavobacteriales bacterium]